MMIYGILVTATKNGKLGNAFFHSMTAATAEEALEATKKTDWYRNSSRGEQTAGVVEAAVITAAKLERDMWLTDAQVKEARALIARFTMDPSELRDMAAIANKPAKAERPKFDPWPKDWKVEGITQEQKPRTNHPLQRVRPM